MEKKDEAWIDSASGSIDERTEEGAQCNKAVQDYLAGNHKDNEFDPPLELKSRLVAFY